MTMVVAFAAPFFMDDFPNDCRFLSPTEKKFAVQRLLIDQGIDSDAEFTWKPIINAFIDWHTWAYALVYIGVAEPLCESACVVRIPSLFDDSARSIFSLTPFDGAKDSLALFTPTILSNLGTFSK